jgi:hypothetical protein
MIAGGWWLAGVLSVAALFGCGPSAGARPPAEWPHDPEVREELNRLKVKEGEACVPPAAMLDSNLRPVDLENHASLMAATGHLVLSCAPVRLASGGRVVDAATRAPIAGATVTVESWHVVRPLAGTLFPNRRLVTTADARTAADGSWEIPPASYWEVAVLLADGFPFFVQGYCVRAPGYEPLTADPWHDSWRLPPRELALRATSVAKDPRPDPARSKCGVPLGPGL